MLELVRHIEYLLTEHDCVLVPGLGGFVLQYVPARFSEDRKSIQPPGKQITFNSSLSYNDGLLAQSLMRTLDIDYGKAVAMIEHWVDEIVFQNPVILMLSGRWEHLSFQMKDH